MTRDKKFFCLALSFVCGVFLYPFVPVELWLLFLALAVLAALAFLWGKERPEGALLVGIGLILGLMRFGFAENIALIANELQEYEGEQISLVCTVAEMPLLKNGKQQVTLAVEDDDFPSGRILAFVSAFGDYAYGERVRFTGKLSLPEKFEDFDYQRYLFAKNIYFVSYYPELEVLEKERGGLLGAIYDFRRRADGNLGRLLPSPEGNILSAMTLGVNSDEIAGVMDGFNKTGTSHIIVVSGSHLVIIITLMVGVLLALGMNRRLIFWPCALGITLFVLLSGSGASAVRSLIMALVFLSAAEFSRGKHAFNALLLSAALMVANNPFILAGDLGFQLSFLAAFGIIWILPRLQKKFASWPAGSGVKDILLATFAAQIATLPVIAYNFGQFSLLSFLANVLILPTVPVLMAGGFLLVGLSFFSLPLAQIASWPLYFILSYQLLVVDFLSRTDFALLKF